MPAKSFDDVLAEAKALPRDDQQRLIEELARPTKPEKGDPPDQNGHVRTLYDALNARGLIACLKDAPTDLSTNPKHMEGFGQDAEFDIPPE